MKKILFSMIITLGFFLNSFAWFDWWFTSISWDTTFSKNSWIDELRVSEDYFIDPYSSSDIKRNTTVCTWNDCPCWASGCSFVTSYSVDWVLFWPSHPKFYSANETRRNWYSYKDGIDSRVVYLENTYTRPDWIYKPDQTVKVRRYYITTYQHDTSTPTCWEVNYYDDEELTQSFSYVAWTWLNEPKYFTMTCLDNETECYCAPDDESCIKKDGKVISTAQLLWHKINPQVSFTNKVKLTDTSCEPGGTFEQVLFDLKTPKFDVSIWWESFNLNNLTLRNYKIQGWKLLDGIEIPWKVEFTRSGSVNRIAWDIDIDLEIEDSFLEDSVHGVSWLKSYEFSITRVTNSSFESITPVRLWCSPAAYTSASEYNSNGNKEISDVKDFSFNCNELTTAWKYNFTFLASDWAWNTTKATTVVNVYPDEISIPNSNLVITNVWFTPFANNVDSYDYMLTFQDQFGNPILDRILTNPSQSITWYSLWKTITLNNSTSALRYLYPSNKTNKSWEYNFSVRSLTPGSITHRYLLSYNWWDENYVQNSSPTPLHITNNWEWEFKKPFSANIALVWPWSTPEVWTEQEYQIQVINDWNIANISGSILNINATTLNFSSWHRFSDISNLDNTFALNDLQCSFSWLIDATSVSSVLESPELDIDSMNVSYSLAWQSIRYPLDSFGLVWCDVSTIWLKTIGSTQWDWKWEITWWSGNFSDISTSTLRNQIRQNAYTLIKGLSSGQISNGVRYVEWDVSITWNQSYETLIVKNGNVFISWNVNPSENTFGIIVLKDDWFNVMNDFNTDWNIYIANSVSSINAHIYADGTLRSANSSGNEYNDSDLSIKLRMKGSLFTRNTIGGWILAGESNYLLPWGATTVDIDLASIYDLNYIRRAQACWDIDDYSFLIEYDPSIQTNPPKWFTTK